MKKLNFKSIKLQANLKDSAELILTDKKHIDNNPKLVLNKDILSLLEKINLGNALN